MVESRTKQVRHGVEVRPHFRFPMLKILAPPALVASLLFVGRTASSPPTALVTAAPQLDFDQRVGHGPGSIAVADVNHDGKLDIVVANSIDGPWMYCSEMATGTSLRQRDHPSYAKKNQ